MGSQEATEEVEVTYDEAEALLCKVHDLDHLDVIGDRSILEDLLVEKIQSIDDPIEHYKELFEKLLPLIFIGEGQGGGYKGFGLIKGENIASICKVEIGE
jgi:hypothetical protein